MTTTPPGDLALRHALEQQVAALAAGRRRPARRRRAPAGRAGRLARSGVRRLRGARAADAGARRRRRPRRRGVAAEQPSRARRARCLTRRSALRRRPPAPTDPALGGPLWVSPAVRPAAPIVVATDALIAQTERLARLHGDARRRCARRWIAPTPSAWARSPAHRRAPARAPRSAARRSSMRRAARRARGGRDHRAHRRRPPAGDLGLQRRRRPSSRRGRCASAACSASCGARRSGRR